LIERLLNFNNRRSKEQYVQHRPSRGSVEAFFSELAEYIYNNRSISAGCTVHTRSSSRCAITADLWPYTPEVASDVQWVQWRPYTPVGAADVGAADVGAADVQQQNCIRPYP
jgi:hypothetical protein